MNLIYSIQQYHPDRVLILSFMVLRPKTIAILSRMVPLKIIFWILAERASNEYDMEMIPGPVLENFDFNDFEIDLNISKSMYSNIFCLRSRSNKSTELSQRKIFKKLFDRPILRVTPSAHLGTTPPSRWGYPSKFFKSQHACQHS